MLSTESHLDKQGGELHCHNQVTTKHSSLSGSNLDPKLQSPHPVGRLRVSATSAPDDRVLVASVDLLSKSEVNYMEVSVEKDVASTEVKSMTGAICRDAINKEQSLLHQCTCHPLR